MLQYVNGFSCALNSQNEDFIISFIQTSPNFENDRDEYIRENIASLVMPKEIAGNLSQALLEMLDDSDEDLSAENLEQEK